VTVLPLVPAERWDLGAVERLAAAIDQGGAPWAR
jgi:hypothetical protein